MTTTGPLPRPSILEIEPYVGGESQLPGVNRVIKLSSNEGPFGPPPAAVAPRPTPPPTPTPVPAPAATAPAAAEAAPVTAPPRDSSLIDFLTGSALLAPVRLSSEGAPDVILDPKSQSYHCSGTGLRALAPHCTRKLKAEDF